MFFRAAGFDDDNDPAPESIPVEGETVPDAQTWGWKNGICGYRKSTGFLADHPAKKMIGCNDVDLKNMTMAAQHVFILLSISIPSRRSPIAAEQVTTRTERTYLWNWRVHSIPWSLVLYGNLQRIQSI
jgi:hypothetical protein